MVYRAAKIGEKIGLLGECLCLMVGWLDGWMVGWLDGWMVE